MTLMIPANPFIQTPHYLNDLGMQPMNHFDNKLFKTSIHFLTEFKLIISDRYAVLLLMKFKMI